VAVSRSVKNYSEPIEERNCDGTIGEKVRREKALERVQLPSRMGTAWRISDEVGGVQH